MSSWLRAAGWTLILLAGAGAVGRLSGRQSSSAPAPAQAAPVTYNRDIAPHPFSFLRHLSPAREKRRRSLC